MSLLGSFVTRIESLIASMTEDDGYNSDWKPLPSVGLANDKNFQSYPCGRAVVINEDNDNPAIFAQAYTNTITVEIIVKDDLETVKQDPKRDIRDVFYSDLEDLKKLFGVDTTLNDLGVEDFNYLGMELIPHEDGDYFTPKHMVVRFTMNYDQDRLNPSQVACI